MKKVSLRELVADKIIFAVLVAIYYWMWARNDWKDFYPTIQTVVVGFTFWYFTFRAIRVRKYKQETADEMAEANLHRCDSICLKVCMAALIGIGFACAIGRLVLTTEVIGYCLMGTLILIEVVRTVAFWLMTRKDSEHGAGHKTERIPGAGRSQAGGAGRAGRGAPGNHRQP